MADLTSFFFFLKKVHQKFSFLKKEIVRSTSFFSTKMTTLLFSKQTI